EHRTSRSIALRSNSSGPTAKSGWTGCPKDARLLCRANVTLDAGVLADKDQRAGGSNAMRIFADIEAVKGAVGETLGISDWVTVDQAMIDRFAEATGDFQWIHVDRERAKASPFGGTIAHGFLTLSLLARLSSETYRVEKLAARLNYGCNKVRFTTPV